MITEFAFVVVDHAYIHKNLVELLDSNVMVSGEVSFGRRCDCMRDQSEDPKEAESLHI